MQYLDCAYVSVLEEYKGHRKPGHVLHILHILHILIYLSTSAWLAQCQIVNLQSSMNAVNKHKFCMWFQCPPYWDAFLLFQWVLQGQYPSPCVETRLTFPELSAINQQTVVMVVGGGTWTAGPWDGGPSSSGNKQWNPAKDFFHPEYAQYAQYAVYNMYNMHNMHLLKYAEYA
jgi:hypothetical protein